MINQLKISVVVPFFNTPPKYFDKCIASLKAVNPYEVILVDDCSTNEKTIKLAKESGFTYLKTEKQSGRDGHPINIGMLHATGEYACTVDSDDELLALPKQMTTDICFGNVSGVSSASNLTIEHLILEPRALRGATVVRRELYLKHPLATDKNVHTDILFILQLLYHKYSFTVFPKVNYIYNDVEDSAINSKPLFNQRLVNLQTVARFCEIESVEPNAAFRLLQFAMLNVQHGRDALKFFMK